MANDAGTAEDYAATAAANAARIAAARAEATEQPAEAEQRRITPHQDRDPTTPRQLGSTLAAMMGLDEPEVPTEAAAETPERPAQVRDPATGKFVTPAAEAAPAQPLEGEDAFIAALTAKVRETIASEAATTTAPATVETKPSAVPALPQAQPGANIAEQIGQMQGMVSELAIALRSQFGEFLPKQGESPAEAMKRRTALAADQPAKWAHFTELASQHSEASRHLAGLTENAQLQMRQRHAQQLKVMHPDWADDTKMQAGVGEIRAYVSKFMTDNGLPAEHAAAYAGRMTDPFEITVVRKAMMFDRFLAKQAQAIALATKKVPADVPPVQRPGARNPATPQDGVATLRTQVGEKRSAESLGAFLNARFAIRN